MNIVRLPGLQRRHQLPLVAFADLQAEYLCKERAYHISAAAERLTNLKRLLDGARRLGLPIAHFRYVGSGYFFKPGTEFADWIEGLAPRANEFVFEHNLPSCFTNDAFNDLIGDVADPHVILAGFAGEQTCLASVIDGYHRGCRMSFVKDCSASGRVGDLDETAAHEAVTSLIELYADVVAVDDVLGRFAAGARKSTSMTST